MPKKKCKEKIRCPSRASQCKRGPMMMKDSDDVEVEKSVGILR